MAELLKILGNADQLAECVRSNSKRYIIEDPPYSTTDISEKYISEKLKTPQQVIEYASNILVHDISLNPFIRQYVREEYINRAVITTVPTRKGLKEIDWLHKYLNVKRLTPKPILDFISELNGERPESMPEQFCLLDDAVNKGYIEYKIQHEDDIGINSSQKKDK